METSRARVTSVIGVLIVLVVTLNAFPATAAVSNGLDSLDAPDACTQETARFVSCTWEWSLGGTSPVSASEDLSWLPANILDARFSIDKTWGYAWAILDEETEEVFVESVSLTGDEMHGTYFLDFRPGGSYVLNVTLQIRPSLPAPPATVRASLVFEITTPTQRANGYAGSPSDPQVVDAVGDTRGPRFTDIAGAWLDDPFLDDGVIEVGVFAPYLAEADVAPHEQLSFDVAWSLLGERWTARWLLHNDSSPVEPVLRNANGTWSAYLQRGASERVMELVPTVDTESGELRAQIALRTIGAPAPGVLFTDMAASGSIRVAGRGVTVTGMTTLFPDTGQGDASAENVRPFAVGGPEVWTALREGDEALVSSSASALAWYQAPFSSENLPDTLQVLGAVAALVTGAGGFLVVRRRREELARLMDDVDAVLEIHADDPKAALRALDALEKRFEKMLRAGRIDEARHALLLGKIERAGYRLMRREQEGREAPAQET